MKHQVKLINRLSRAITCFLFLALLSIGVALGSSPAEAQPFAYVANGFSGTVSVIDTATNSPVVPDITVESAPTRVAITPDGSRAYVTNQFSDTVSVITTSNNQVLTTVTLPAPPLPAVYNSPYGIAITPDGKRAYVANQSSSSVSVIDTNPVSPNFNTVIATVPLPVVPLVSFPFGIAITPDGSRAYVANGSSGTVSVIDTATNTILGAAISVESVPFGVAITPDGNRVYVTNSGDGTVSVIDTTNNTILGAPVPVGSFPLGLAITPPSTIVPFSDLAAKVEIEDDEFEVKATFTLGTGSNGIDPLTEDVSFQVGTFSTIIPAGSFKLHPEKSGKKGKHVKPNKWTFEGVIDGVKLEAKITDLGGGSFEFKAEGKRADLTGTVNPVEVGLIIGDDGGSTTVTADFE